MPKTPQDVSLRAADWSIPLPGNAKFAITVPGLPPLSSASPQPGTFAELDTDDTGYSICPDAEPAGVDCEDGGIVGLAPGTTYTATQLTAPPGYVIAAPETFVTSTSGHPSVAQFVNNRA